MSAIYTNDELRVGRKPTPSHMSIRYYWSAILAAIGKFDSTSEAEEDDYCFACGMQDVKTEKAHIVPHCEGGDESVSNLHLLCATCHRDSEALTDERYWVWLVDRNFGDVLLSRASRHGFNLTGLFADLEVL